MISWAIFCPACSLFIVWLSASLLGLAALVLIHCRQTINESPWPLASVLIHCRQTDSVPLCSLPCFRHWLLGGDSLAAQAAASSDYNGFHAARGGVSTIEFRWAARGGDALVAASGSGAAGRKGRGTVGARVPTVRQERTSGMSAGLRCGLVAHNRANSDKHKQASAPPLVPASCQVRPRSPNCH